MIEEKTMAFGPKRKGPNILLNKFLEKEESFFQKIYQTAEKVLEIPRESVVDIKKEERRQKEQEERFDKVKKVLQVHDASWRDMCNAFITGFDIATKSGPICEEPMLGAAFLIENVQLIKSIGLK
jgi:ribosome assembly protein 1